MNDTRPTGPTARPFVPDSRDIESLRQAAAVQGATGSSVIATWHPSAVLQAHGGPAEARRMFDELAGDLRLAASHSKTKPKASRRKTGS